MKKHNIKKQNDKKNLGWILVRNRLIAQLGINVFRYEKDAHKKHVKVAVTIIVAICLMFFSLYCGAAAYGYGILGMTDLIPGIAMAVSSIVALFFTIFKANGDLFGYQDYELILSLPIPINTVVSSRLINMYFWNTFITVLVMVPMAVVYGFFAKPSIIGFFAWFVGIILTCLIPTVIAAFFGAIITAIASKFRYASAVSSILGIGFVVALMILPMWVSAGGAGMDKIVNPNNGKVDIAGISNLVPEISNGINNIYPPVKFFSDAVVDSKLLSLLLFAGISILLYGAFVLLLSVDYRKINTGLTSHSTKGNYKLDKLQQSSMLSALYKKTIMRILKSSVCATNLLISSIMAILLSLTSLIIGPEKVLGGLNLSDNLSVVGSAGYYVLAAIISMTNTAAVSLALEGKNIWIIQSLPIPPKILYDSYILTNLSFTVPTSILCGILVSISLETSFVGTVLMICTPLFFSLFVAVVGVCIGNRMAYFDWREEGQLVKQSMMSILGMLGGVVVIALCGVIANLRLIPASPNIITIVFIGLALIGTGILYMREMNRPIKE